MHDPAAAAHSGLSKAQVLAHTTAWLQRAVIGLNLCPFAKAPAAKGLVRLVVCMAEDPASLLDTLRAELRFLAAADPLEMETTLLVHPRVLLDFLDFNDFLDLADAELESLDLEGVLQLASFHPDYRFAGTPDDDLGNATNRAPYPTLHLLREASIDRAVTAFADPEAIVDHNLRALNLLGADGWAELQALCRADAGLPRSC
jgi:hypothetical protein